MSWHFKRNFPISKAFSEALYSNFVDFVDFMIFLSKNFNKVYDSSLLLIKIESQKNNFLF